MKKYRISDIISSAPEFTAKDIKDYAKISEIFNLYMNDCYDTMTHEIANYGRFEFFTDLTKYLTINLNNENWRKLLYRDILDEYTYRIVEYKLSSWHERKKKTKSWHNF